MADKKRGKKDLTGQRFGHLTVVEKTDKRRIIIVSGVAVVIAAGRSR